MGFLNTNSMPRLVEKLADGDNIKITGNSKGNSVGTVIKKIVEKADEVTKAIKQEVVNDSYSFKVGTGNVDVSADVEDGFGEIGVKGITLQNCYPPLTTSNFSTLNGTITSDGYVSMQGDGANWKNAWIDINKCLIKPNTTYTLVCYVLENTLVEGLNLTTASNQCVFRATNKVPAKTTGLLCYIATTIGDFTSVPNGLRSYLSNTETGKIVFKVMILEGDHTNNPNLPSYFEGIQGVGDKSKNLFNGALKVGAYANANGVYQPNTANYICCKESIKVSPDKDYVISLADLSVRGIDVHYRRSDKSFIKRISVRSSTHFTTDSDCEYITFNIPSTADTTTRVKLEEGTIATLYQEHWEGHKIEILSCGKNILNPQKWIYGSSMVWQKFKVNSNLQLNVLFSEVVDYIECYSCEEGEQDLQYGINGNWKIVKVLNNSSKVAFSRKSEKDRYLILCTNQKNFNDVFKNANASFDSDLITLKPYIEDKTQILLDEPLMRLPNGVCDEITRDGKLIRRVGKYVFTGNENISPWITTGENTYGVGVKNLLFGTGSYSKIEILSTVLPNSSPSGINGTNDVEGIALWDNNNFIRFKVARTKLDSQDVTGVTNWLKNLHQQGIPLIVYYKLATPVITELPAPYLRMFKDGHLRFNTLVAPESNHVVQLNKSAQIERSIREVQSLDSRVGKLESFYDDMMLETSHKLSLLNYDFEYTKESEDI